MQLSVGHMQEIAGHRESEKLMFTLMNSLPIIVVWSLIKLLSLNQPAVTWVYYKVMPSALYALSEMASCLTCIFIGPE